VPQEALEMFLCALVQHFLFFLQPVSLKYLNWMKKDTGVSGTDIFSYTLVIGEDSKSATLIQVEWNFTRIKLHGNIFEMF